MRFNKEIALLIGGVLLSIAIALLLYAFSHEPLISVTIALLAIVMTLQIEQILRLDKGLEKHTRHTNLWHMVDSNPMLKSLIPEIIESANTVLTKPNTDLFINYGSYRLANVRNDFQSLAQGYLYTPYADIEPLLLATRRAKRNIRAVSVFRLDAWFWNSHLGKRYWTENQLAIGRGVIIERIFICEALDDKIRTLAKEQHDAGVCVYTAVGDQIPKYLREDLIVFDDDFTYKALTNADGAAVENQLSINAADINKKIQDFSMAKTLADEFHLKG